MSLLETAERKQIQTPDLDRIRLSEDLHSPSAVIWSDIFEVQFVHVSHFLHGSAPYDPLFTNYSNKSYVLSSSCLVSGHFPSLLFRHHIIIVLYIVRSFRVMMCHSQISIFSGNNSQCQ